MGASGFPLATALHSQTARASASLELAACVSSSAPGAAGCAGTATRLAGGFFGAGGGLDSSPAARVLPTPLGSGRLALAVALLPSAVSAPPDRPPDPLIDGGALAGAVPWPVALASPDPAFGGGSARPASGVLSAGPVADVVGFDA